MAGSPLMRFSVLMTPTDAAQFLRQLADEVEREGISMWGYTDEGITGEEPVVKLENRCPGHKWMLPALADSILKQIGGCK